MEEAIHESYFVCHLPTRTCGDAIAIDIALHRIDEVRAAASAEVLAHLQHTEELHEIVCGRVRTAGLGEIAVREADSVDFIGYVAGFHVGEEHLGTGVVAEANHLVETRCVAAPILGAGVDALEQTIRHEKFERARSDVLLVAIVVGVALAALKLGVRDAKAARVVLGEILEQGIEAGVAIGVGASEFFEWRHDLGDSAGRWRFAAHDFVDTTGGGTEIERTARIAVGARYFGKINRRDERRAWRLIDSRCKYLVGVCLELVGVGRRYKRGILRRKINPLQHRRRGRDNRLIIDCDSDAFFEALVIYIGGFFGSFVADFWVELHHRSANCRLLLEIWPHSFDCLGDIVDFTFATVLGRDNCQSVAFWYERGIDRCFAALRHEGFFDILVCLGRKFWSWRALDAMRPEQRRRNNAQIPRVRHLCHARGVIYLDSCLLERGRGDGLFVIAHIYCHFAGVIRGVELGRSLSLWHAADRDAIDAHQRQRVASRVEQLDEDEEYDECTGAKNKAARKGCVSEDFLDMGEARMLGPVEQRFATKLATFAWRVSRLGRCFFDNWRRQYAIFFGGRRIRGVAPLPRRGEPFPPILPMHMS